MSRWQQQMRDSRAPRLVGEPHQLHELRAHEGAKPQLKRLEGLLEESLNLANEPKAESKLRPRKDVREWQR